LGKAPCFCNKTLVDLWFGETEADSLTYCPNCKQQYEVWAKICDEANDLSKIAPDFN
jgi:hypothetical protein